MMAAGEKEKGMATAVERRNTELATSVWALLNSPKMLASIKGVLPKHITADRIVMIAFTAMRQNPKLLECSHQSVIGALMTASILGLEPSGPLGHGALVPYKGECQFQPMYQGLLELARRSGLIKDIQLRPVYEGDTYVYRFGLDPIIEHMPMEGEGAANPNRRCTHVYCVIRFTNGGVQWDQMSMPEALAHAKRFSPTWDSRSQEFYTGSSWREHPVAMALKTVCKRVLKLCPKSVEMSLAVQLDDIGESGRRAEVKALDNGMFSLEIDGGEAPQLAELAPRNAIDEIVAASKAATANSAEAGLPTAQAGTGAGTVTPPASADTPSPAAAPEGSGGAAQVVQGRTAASTQTAPQAAAGDVVSASRNRALENLRPKDGGAK